MAADAAEVDTPASDAAALPGIIPPWHANDEYGPHHRHQCQIVRRFHNKVWYPFLTRWLDAKEVTFLNYGYEEDPPMGLPLYGVR